MIKAPKTYLEIADALTAANERIMEWSDRAMEFSTIASRYEEELAAEREVSDKLEKALAQFIDAIPGDVIGKKAALAAIAKVAAIRKGEKQ